MAYLNIWKVSIMHYFNRNSFSNKGVKNCLKFLFGSSFLIGFPWSGMKGFFGVEEFAHYQ
jgi:hypothetical protein